MLVLLGPDFDGSTDAYKRLARVTGLVAYDLKARVRPGTWGVVKALADETQAESLAAALELAGFRPLLISRQVAHAPDRTIVHALGVKLGDGHVILEFEAGEMTVEYAALGCLVRGEVQPGRTASSSSSSSNPRSGIAPEPPSVREVPPFPHESYQAADLHFTSVGWVARIDARVFGPNGVRELDALCDELGRRARIRVDRAVKSSSLATFGEQAASLRVPSSETFRRDHRREQPDERFDAYSRLVGEAERLRRMEHTEAIPGGAERA